MQRVVTAKVTLTAVAVLAVFAAVVAGVSWRLRARIRAQILGQEASVLHALTHFQAERGDREVTDLVLGLVDLEGVIGIRFYDREGDARASLPQRLTARPLPTDMLPQVHRADGIARFLPDVLLDTLFADPLGELTPEPVPLLSVLVDLEPDDSRPDSGGYVQFLVDGAPMAEAFADLDRALLGQFLVAMGVGGGLILGVLLLSLLRLEHANRALGQANRELTLHLKTAALGSVSAHLFHRLNHAVGDLRKDDGGDQVRAMVREVLDLLQDEELGLSYRLDGQDLLDLAAAPHADLAAARGVEIRLDGDPRVELPSRRGNLVVLAVQNVLHNAIEATPRGGVVDCRCTRAGHELRVAVQDQGPGIPEDQRRYLFEPGFSGKVNGNGIGLSISRQLCRLANGDLRLDSTGAHGSTFVVSMELETAKA
jgi:signal transduction histidine kinase